MQWAWSQIAGGPSMQFSYAMLYAWGALMELPPPDHTVSTSGQVMVGWWLVFCVVIFTGFESALISHLTVNRARTKPPETMDDLVKTDGWKWGIEAWILSGVPYEYFVRHTNPVVQTIYRNLEPLDVHTALKKVLKGRYSLIDFTYVISIHVARYADKSGRTPFFISKKGFNFMATFGWGFRKGASYYIQFNQMTRQLDAAGIIRYWLRKVMEDRIKENRAKDEGKTLEYIMKDDSGETILGLDHLQGAFYLLFLGSTLALLSVLGENLACSRF